VPYDLPEIVQDLKQLADYDCDTFLPVVLPRHRRPCRTISSPAVAIGCSSKKFSRERLDGALADRVVQRKIEFLLLDGEQFRTVTVPYADGLRYLELVRNHERPDVLSEILKPVPSRPGK
jgi:hypothetical protein